MLNSASYRDYLFEGLAHEVMHFYTTTAAQGKYKSVLYPAPDCPPAQASLLGEALNLYFAYQFVGDYFQTPDLLRRHLVFGLERHRKTGRRNGLLDLFWLDQELGGLNTSLLALFRELILWKQQAPGPYRSGEILFETLSRRMNIHATPEMKETVLGQNVPDYNTLLQTRL
jgi:hypothetical protein